VFFEPSETPYDLRWRMFNVPVRVHPLFWIISAALGWNATDLGIQYLLLWVLAVFVSILVHELGHVFMGRLFGSDGHIVLYSFGGLAIGSSNLRNRWQRVAVYFAGPGAGFLLAALLWFGRSFFTGNQLASWLLSQMLYINVFWGLLNLLPIWPLDGGQVSREVCGQVFPWRGVAVSLGISAVVAGILALLKSGLLTKQEQVQEAIIRVAVSLPHWLIRPWLYLTLPDLFMAIFFAMMAAGSIQAYQAEAQRHRWRDEEFPWAR
jgi:Zn-dependent protease